jgi:hypothetical protein
LGAQVLQNQHCVFCFGEPAVIDLARASIKRKIAGRL